MKIIPTVEQIVRVMRAKRYPVYERDGLDLNLVGVRQAEEANRFDDLIFVFWQRVGVWCSIIMPATTDPGTYWLQNPMASMGTAIVKPGHYRGVWRIGMHQGKYEALVQKQPVTVIRDGNRDGRMDVSGGVEETGLMGINLHHASASGESVQVDKWSAGCQVVADICDFEVLMGVCRQAAGRFGNSFSYTLLEQSDFGLLVD